MQSHRIVLMAPTAPNGKLDLVTVYADRSVEWAWEVVSMPDCTRSEAAKAVRGLRNAARSGVEFKLTREVI